MATYTPNLRLTKPDKTDNAVIGVVNANMDTLDTEITTVKSNHATLSGTVTQQGAAISSLDSRVTSIEGETVDPEVIERVVEEYLAEHGVTPGATAEQAAAIQANSAAIADLPNSYVPQTREINGHALSADVTLTAADVNAVPTSALTGITRIIYTSSSSTPPSAPVVGTVWLHPVEG